MAEEQRTEFCRLEVYPPDPETLKQLRREAVEAGFSSVNKYATMLMLKNPIRKDYQTS